MRKLLELVVCVGALALALSTPMVAGANAGSHPSTSGTVAEARGASPSLEHRAAESQGQALLLEDIGCTATYNCVHGTIVSCSSPLVGTCTSSGARCGEVTCNGVTTRCPGYCYGDHHCYSFCMSQGSSDGYCDSFGCCVCL
jgi:hypothetical protein